MEFLTEDFLIHLNQLVINRYSPEEIIGVKEPGALKMLIHAPKEIVFARELYPTIYEKAAILMINIATKHVFHNGNKRTAFTAMHYFMKLIIIMLNGNIKRVSILYYGSFENMRRLLILKNIE